MCGPQCRLRRCVVGSGRARTERRGCLFALGRPDLRHGCGRAGRLHRACIVARIRLRGHRFRNRILSCQRRCVRHDGRGRRIGPCRCSLVRYGDGLQVNRWAGLTARVRSRGVCFAARRFEHRRRCRCGRCGFGYVTGRVGRRRSGVVRGRRDGGIGRCIVIAQPLCAVGTARQRLAGLIQRDQESAIGTIGEHAGYSTTPLAALPTSLRTPSIRTQSSQDSTCSASNQRA